MSNITEILQISLLFLPENCVEITITEVSNFLNQAYVSLLYSFTYYHIIIT